MKGISKSDVSKNPNPKTISDLDLVQKIKNGEQHHFSEIVSRYENLIYQYTLRMCGNQPDAEDILQETFLNAFRAIDRFRGDSKLATWLYRIANNSCLMKKRKSKFAPEKELSLSDIISEPGSRNYQYLEASNASPMSKLLDVELKEKLQQIILDLPKKHRQSFVLADIQGFSGQEIADILGVSIPTVKSRLHRARLFVRQKLSHYLEIETRI
ncbi:RNA polymerase sigma factor [candidate division CSSED10-310 bacterium]|uniref:RNA polymerase sigma factor n=1 Tax=candidate division CSSED10-310 bacterium TaxID=2855610 RepID=A0ABV6Z3F0_UNCC1